MNDIVLRAENLGKAYPLPKGELRVFQGIDFELRRGDLAVLHHQVRKIVGQDLFRVNDTDSEKFSRAC